MRKLWLSACLSLGTFIYLPAQQKEVSYEQAFQMAPTGITQTLPTITKWIDDNQYVETRRNEDRTTTSELVNIKTGARTPYNETAETTARPDLKLDKEAKNPTWSPDGKMVAYTLNNNLYVREAATGKETQLTNDGSDVIKNGYASWVYCEQVIGRGGRFRAIW